MARVLERAGFVFAKIVTMKTPLLNGEQTIKESAANMARGAESVGGRLFCTNQRLVFESHAVNIQTGTMVLELAQITSAKPVWTKAFGVLPLAPNSFEITLKDGTTHSFVVTGRGDWIAIVERARGAASS